MTRDALCRQGVLRAPPTARSGRHGGDELLDNHHELLAAGPECSGPARSRHHFLQGLPLLFTQVIDADALAGVGSGTSEVAVALLVIES